MDLTQGHLLQKSVNINSSWCHEPKITIIHKFVIDNIIYDSVTSQGIVLAGQINVKCFVSMHDSWLVKSSERKSLAKVYFFPRHCSKSNQLAKYTINWTSTYGSTHAAWLWLFTKYIWHESFHDATTTCTPATAPAAARQCWAQD